MARTRFYLISLSLLVTVIAAGWYLSNGWFSEPVASINMKPAISTPAVDFYTLTAKDSHHQMQEFSQYKGKVVLIVNVASNCGFTKQYKGLEDLYRTYKDQGLVILGFPCNQFGGQEPNSLEEINLFCKNTYGVTFPIMEKVNVNGNTAHPVWLWLKSQKSGLLGVVNIKWNFEKFLIGRDGKVAERWSSVTTPKGLESQIKLALSHHS